MTHRYFIVAGTHAEYQSWVMSNVFRFPQATDFMWVQSSVVFRGYTNPHGFFVGTFRDRSDLYEIVSTIIICSPDMAKQAKLNLVNSILSAKRLHHDRLC